MRKIVITVVAVGLSAVAAYAQNMADARFTADCMKGYMSCKKAKQETKKAPSNKTRQAGMSSEYLSRALIKAIERQQIAEAKKAADQAEKTEKADTKNNSEYPFYYTGKEGHVMILGDKDIRQARSASKKKSADKKTDKSEGNWFTRLMGFSKYEYETAEEWQARLYSMSK